MQNTLAVGIGSFLGGIGRYHISILTIHYCPLNKFPVATLIVNAIGCLLIGIAASLYEQNIITEQQKLLLVSGLLGGFTTFSAFGLETYELLKSNQLTLAALNVVISVLVSIIAVYLGMKVISFLSN